MCPCPRFTPFPSEEWSTQEEVELDGEVLTVEGERWSTQDEVCVDHQDDKAPDMVRGEIDECWLTQEEEAAVNTTTTGEN